MAWNDPPSFDYQQMSNSGRKFKHRYVLSETNSKLGQSSPQFQQAPTLANNNHFQQQHQPMAPIHQGHPQQQPFNMDQSQPTQLLGPQPTYSSSSNSNNVKSDNGMITSNADMLPLGGNGPYHGFNGGSYGVASDDQSHNNFNNNNQTTMYQDPQQHQFQSAPPPPPPQQMLFQQQQSFQPQ